MDSLLLFKSINFHLSNKSCNILQIRFSFKYILDLYLSLFMHVYYI